MLPTISFATIPDYIINAVIFVESSNQPHVESIDGCRGLGQIQKETWYWLCTLMGKNWSFDEAFDPGKNRVVTAFYLNWLEQYLKQHGYYSLELLFACYNAGPGTVRRYRWHVPPYYETKMYVQKVNQYLKDSERK